jgi:hypothetical protein
MSGLTPLETLFSSHIRIYFQEHNRSYFLLPLSGFYTDFRLRGISADSTLSHSIARGRHHGRRRPPRMQGCIGSGWQIARIRPGN